MGASFGRSVQSCLNWQRELFLNEFERDGLVIDLHLFFVLCGLWTSHESWVVPAGVSSALAVLGGEIPSRIDSSTIWGVGVKLWKNQSFWGEGGGFGVSIPPWSGQLCVRKG